MHHQKACIKTCIKHRSDLSSLCLLKKKSLLSLSAKCYLFQLQMYTSVLCILMGTLEGADTTSNNFKTSTGSVNIPSEAASIATEEGTKIHSNSKIIQDIHSIRGRICGLRGFCLCLIPTDFHLQLHTQPSFCPKYMVLYWLSKGHYHTVKRVHSPSLT